MAYGSLREVETQILIAERLGYLEQTEVHHLMETSAEVGRLINGLTQSLTR
ncbi:MAG: four helix bundle protein [Pyrinomonadaceae bacterium]|nr:four helix bundle protein [Pyrinomonadaceae bacterium]